jgi:hypothetical protein
MESQFRFFSYIFLKLIKLAFFKYKNKVLLVSIKERENFRNRETTYHLLWNYS